MQHADLARPSRWCLAGFTAAAKANMHCCDHPLQALLLVGTACDRHISGRVWHIYCADETELSELVEVTDQDDSWVLSVFGGLTCGVT
jgi:hypothetical protein